MPTKTRPIFTVEIIRNAATLVDPPPMATSITSIKHGRKLLNLMKIYINKAKYSGRNNSFTLKLANL